MSTVSASSENAIWARVIHPEDGEVPVAAAEYFLSLQFEKNDLIRMHELTEKNQAGELTAEEEGELRRFRHVGLQIDLLRSKGRLALREAK
ncbi:hypothetical protein [Anatilimnocola floriformis]|uniref:hypothetical protein n=1 Tax=Anatilimnocola floriformis TaxID=2948575 RepID=UPI0020C5460A|nr:hypothetical protein [Anatilimnocola floriformis]